MGREGEETSVWGREKKRKKKDRKKKQNKE